MHGPSLHQLIQIQIYGAHRWQIQIREDISDTAGGSERVRGPLCFWDIPGHAKMSLGRDQGLRMRHQDDHPSRHAGLG